MDRLSEEEIKAIEKLSSKKNETTWYDTIRKIKREEITDVVVTRQKYITIILNLIERQQKELDKKDKIIDKMAEKINQAYFDECNMWFWFEKEICSKNKDGKYDFKDLGTRKTRIKEYFKKEVEKDVKD